MASSEVLRATAAIARAHRAEGSDSPRLDDLRRDLAVAKLTEYINKTVDAAPPLSNEQRERLATLLRGGPVAV